jgi:hypothetical protein
MAKESRPATDKQISYLKKLVRDRKVMTNIDYDSLSSFEASKLIDRIQNAPKGDSGKGYPAVKSVPAADDKDIGAMHGMCFKLAHVCSCNASGDIPEDKEEQFKATVANLARLSMESMANVRAVIPRETGL